MIRLLFVMLLIPSLTLAQEGWLDDVEVQAETPEVYVDPVLTELDAIRNELASLKQSIASFKMPTPTDTCQCDCDCPTIDEIRQVVREELDRVTVTLRTSTGAEKKVELPLTKKASPQVIELQLGETVVAIDGVPCQPFQYQSQVYQAPVTQYATPRYEMRVLNQGNRFFGAVRQSTCRMVNGVKVCN